MILSVVAGILVIFITSYYLLKPEIPAWSQRGFEPFEKEWHKIFIVAAAIAVAVALFSWWKTDYNATVGLVVGLMAGFFAIAAYTDAIVHKIPIEVSRLTIIVSVIAALVGIFTQVEMPQLYQEFFPLITTSWLQMLLICVGVLFIGVLGFIKVKNSIGWVLLFIGYMGFFLAVYVLICGIFILTSDTYWHYAAYKLLAIWAFIGVILLFDLLVGGKMGHADIKLMYAAGFAFAWWSSAYMLFVIMLVAFFLQFIAHFVATPLQIGTMRSLPVGPFEKFWIRLKRLFKRIPQSEPMPEKYESFAVPFLPILALTFISGILILL